MKKVLERERGFEFYLGFRKRNNHGRSSTAITVGDDHGLGFVIWVPWPWVGFCCLGMKMSMSSALFGVELMVVLGY